LTQPRGRRADRRCAQNIAQKTADKTKEIATAVGSNTSESVSTAGEAITDGWITTTVNAGFVGEALLKRSNINVDTQDHVVTLKGVVGSDAAKARAIAIALATGDYRRLLNTASTNMSVVQGPLLAP